MNPLPLTDPSGTIRAWACGHCFRVSSSVSCGGNSAEARQRETDYYKTRAEECGVCRGCKKEIDCSSSYSKCAECREVENAEWVARVEALRPQREAQDKIAELALAKAKDRDIAMALRDKMSNISESYWCAGWLTGLEYSLWYILEHAADPTLSADSQYKNFGMSSLLDDEIASLNSLRQKAGGWWFWSEEAQQEIFITTDEFKLMYEKHNS